MDPHTQHQPEPISYTSLPAGSDPGRQPYNAPFDPSRPSYNGPLTGSSTLPYRPRPGAPEAGQYPQDSSPVPPSSYPHTSGEPVQFSTQTSSATYNPPQPNGLAHASPRPISDPAAKLSNAIPPVNTVYNYDHNPNPPATFPAPPAQTAFAPNTAAAAAATVAQPPTTANQTLDQARSHTQSAVRELLSLRRQQQAISQVQAQTNGWGAPPAAAAVNGAGAVVNGVSTSGSGGRPGKGGDHWPYQTGDVAAQEVGERLRVQTALVLQALRGLEGRAEGVVGKAEAGRWRRLLVGGVV